MSVTIPPRYPVLGVGVNALSLELTITILREYALAGKGGYVCCAPVHPITLAIKDVEYRRVLNRSLLTTPDGMPIVWLGRGREGDQVERVYGPDLLQGLCGPERGEGLKHYLYGGREGVAEVLAKRLEQQNSGLRIVGVETPPYHILGEDELFALAERIRSSGAQMLWVGLGVPKQECLMARLEAYLPEVVQIGVGAAFDFLSGTKRQAPRWMQRHALEWLFRLTCEPRRLGGRYLFGNTLFLWYLALERLGLRSYPLTGIKQKNLDEDH